VASLTHNTGKLNVNEGIQENTHTFRPMKHHISPINTLGKYYIYTALPFNPALLPLQQTAENNEHFIHSNPVTISSLILVLGALQI
jgi:hypothetical protein